MKNPFSGLFRARDKPQDSVSAAPTFYFGTSGSGKAVNAQTAIQLSTVYACVRVISETVASLPLGVYEAKEDGNRKEGAIAFGNNDNRKTYNQTSSVNLSGNNFYVRDEQDIRSLAIEIATLTKRQQRGRGLRMA